MITSQWKLSTDILSWWTDGSLWWVCALFDEYRTADFCHTKAALNISHLQTFFFNLSIYMPLSFCVIFLSILLLIIFRCSFLNSLYCSLYPVPSLILRPLQGFWFFARNSGGGWQQADSEEGGWRRQHHLHLRGQEQARGQQTPAHHLRHWWVDKNRLHARILYAGHEWKCVQMNMLQIHEHFPFRCLQTCMWPWPASTNLLSHMHMWLHRVRAGVNTYMKVVRCALTQMHIQSTFLHHHQADTLMHV